MAKPLRSDEVLACLHRVALNRGAPFEVIPAPVSVELERRRRVAIEHRESTLDQLRMLHSDHVVPTSTDETTEMMRSGAPLLIAPRLAPDRSALRRANVHALVRVGRVDDRFSYAPILVKNNEVVEVAATRRILEGSLAEISPHEATFTDGVGVRSTLTVRRNGIALAHATRVLESMGFADHAARGAIIDRQRRVWWLEVGTSDHYRFNLTAYDGLYAQRVDVLRAHDVWLNEGGRFPTSPYWHRECLDCPFAPQCEDELARRDDVSLVRFTNLDQQVLLQEHGIHTRDQLACLDPARARRARAKTLIVDESFTREDALGRSIDKLDDLIYRARAHVHGSSLRISPADQIGCPTADIEVDIDMESYDDVTYLWGAFVTVNQMMDGVDGGYRSFVDWNDLSPESETRIFADMWSWLSEVRERCHAQGRSFAAYCFWAQAEDGAMNRAVLAPLSNGPTREDLEQFRRAMPSEWIDLHEQAKRQIQTEGPLGLKQLATAAGFRWRDEHPSGEASMLWYEVASVDPPDATATSSRQRLLAYNEDDCRATKALRDWLNGPARLLAHRDDLF